MVWIGEKKGTNELGEISMGKCYELPSEFKNSSNSTWHTATLTTQTCPRGLFVCLFVYLFLFIYYFI